MKTGFANQIRNKLKIYSEMTGKNKLEAIYDALSIAKSVREKTIDLKKLFVPVEIENRYTIQNRLRAEKQRLYWKQYYQRNSERLKARRK